MLVSTKVPNPEQLLGWLQGGRPRPGRLVRAGWASPVPADAEIEVDAVGTARNAARVIAALHRGEKRLVFCDSRRQAEEVASWLRAYEVDTFVSHSSLSADERRRAEEAFAAARDCVVVATSTLELGVDVGDLDRVIHLDAPSTVAAFLQRLGRTGRRPGATRNCLFLATRQDALLRALGLLLLWSRGFVEPIQPPPDPAHVIAQQVLALALQEGAVPGPNVASWWDGLPGFGDAGCVREAVEHLLAAGYLDVDQGLVFVGPEAEQRYGHRHFRDLTSVLAADPEFCVQHGRAEVGSVHPLSLVTRVEGPRLLLLAGRSWRVEHIDWHRRRCHVVPVETGGRVRWQGEPRPLHTALAQAMREVVLGADTSASSGVRLSRRGTDALSGLREECHATVDPARTVVLRDRDGGLNWWTWAGAAVNATLAAALAAVRPGLTDPVVRHHNLRLGLGPKATREQLSAAAAELAGLGTANWPGPQVTEQALEGLKFAEMLPPERAMHALSRRLSDRHGAVQAVSTDRLWAER